jgi:hypothetical protein
VENLVFGFQLEEGPERMTGGKQKEKEREREKEKTSALV